MSEYPMSGLRPPRQRLEVHPVEDAGDAVAAADAPDGIDGGVAEGRVEIGQPLVVGAGQIAVAVAGVRAQDRFVIQRTAERLGRVVKSSRSSSGPAGATSAMRLPRRELGGRTSGFDPM